MNYRELESWTAVAAKLGVTPARVYQAIKEATGSRARDLFPPKKKGEKPPTDLLLLRESGMSISALATRYNVCPATVSAWFRTLDVKPERPRKYTDEDAVRLYEQHQSLIKVAKILGVAMSGVCIRLLQAGVKLRAKGDCRKKSDAGY